MMDACAAFRYRLLQAQLSHRMLGFASEEGNRNATLGKIVDAV